MSFVNIHPFLSFRSATHSKKSWDRSNLGLVVTGMTRRETFGSKCKLFINIHGQYRQGRAGANGYGIDKTEE